MKFTAPIIWLDTIDSTNSEIYRRIDELDNLSVIAAFNQTKGKGQRGNVWLTESSANLTFSMLLKFGESALSPIEAIRQFTISEAVTCALADFFSQEGIDVSIKWPNDIYYGDKKLVGILIENILNGKNVAASIIGIGINCNQIQFPSSLLNPTSMSLITKKIYDLKPTLEEVCSHICLQLELMETEGGKESIHSRYLSNMYRLNEWHNFRDMSDDTVFNGRITGISDSAMLQVEMPDGSSKEFAFKEIGYIL